MALKPSGKNLMSEFTRSDRLEKEAVDAQGDLTRAFGNKYGVQRFRPRSRRPMGLNTKPRTKSGSEAV